MTVGSIYPPISHPSCPSQGGGYVLGFHMDPPDKLKDTVKEIDSLRRVSGWTQWRCFLVCVSACGTGCASDISRCSAPRPYLVSSTSLRVHQTPLTILLQRRRASWRRGMRSSIRTTNRMPLHSTVWMGPRWVGGMRVVASMWVQVPVAVSVCACRSLTEDLSTARSWALLSRSSPVV